MKIICRKKVLPLRLPYVVAHFPWPSQLSNPIEVNENMMLKFAAGGRQMWCYSLVIFKQHSALFGG